MIDFANRFWLYLLPVAVVLLILLFQMDRRGRRVNIRRFASNRLVRDLLQSYSPWRKRLKNIVILLGVCFLFLALARPQWGHTWTESRSRGIDIVFALDTSRSMLARDIKPNRLIRAKLAIEDFVNQLEGDRIGLVAFSGSAFLQCPLTLDYDAFFQSLDAVDTNVISAGGTDLSAAIKESESAFSAENNFKIVVLITDGEDLEGRGIEQAEKSAQDGVTIYTVGVGTAEGAPIPIRSRSGQIEYVRDESGQVVQSHIEPETLETIAQSTDGFYVPLGTTGYGLEQVLEAGVGSIPEEEISSQLQRTAIERFQWPLGLALLCFALEPLIGTRRGRRIFGKRHSSTTALILGLVGASLVLPQADTVAQTATTEDSSTAASPLNGSKPAESNPTKEAQEEAPVAAPPTAETAFARAVANDPLNPINHFNRGTELYEDEDFPRAAKFFTESLRLSDDFQFQSDVFYNLGNTRYREGLFSFGETSPGQVTENATNVSAQNQPPMQAGQQILDAARIQPPPQQQIQQTIQALEQRKTATGESIQSLGTALENESAVQNLWQRSINDFESALELNPRHDDARHNLDFVKKQAAGLATQISTQERLKDDQARQQTEIERLIEELKKLLEEQQDQENQQDQQQNQQDQQQDQQQDSSDQQQQDQQQQSNDQQNQQDQQQSENQDQSSSDEQESSAEQESQDTPSEGEDSSNDGSEENPQDQQQPDEESSEASEEEPASEGETPEAEEQSDQEQPGEEESSSGEEPSSEDSAQEDENTQEPIQLSEEQAEQIAEELAESAGGTEGEEGEPSAGGEEVVIGVMSTDDAARLLDSLKPSERKLPFAGSGSEGSPNRDNRKNW